MDEREGLALWICVWLLAAVSIMHSRMLRQLQDDAIVVDRTATRQASEEGSAS